MDKIRLFSVLAITLFLASAVSADVNLTQSIINSNALNGQNWSNMTCDQKLNQTANWYNSCVLLLQDDTSSNQTAIVYHMLNNYNAQCKLALNKALSFKWAAFIGWGIIGLFAIFWIIKNVNVKK